MAVRNSEAINKSHVKKHVLKQLNVILGQMKVFYLGMPAKDKVT